jgi:O-antigen ligase
MPSDTAFGRRSVETTGLAPVLIGLWAAAIALAPDPATKALVAAPALIGAVAWWTLLAAERWLALFFFCAILLPPLPAPVGNAGVHIAPLFAFLGLFAGVLRMSRWRAWRSSLPVLFCLFLAVITASTALAALYSGLPVALGSMARAILFGIGVYVFVYTYSGPRAWRADPMRFTRYLFFAGAASALFACVDFYFQLPAPAGYGAQYIWVGQDVLRRAQGLFYEASTLGNFCAFFLVMVLVSFFRPREERLCSRFALGTCGAVFAGALIFSYSRASLVALAVAGCAFLYLQGVRIRPRSVAGLLIALASIGALARFAMPALAAFYWTRLAASFQFLSSAPNDVLSGRIGTWGVIGNFLWHQPWHMLFGIGYKTLPYTDYVGSGVIADNTYLSLLVETGLLGLGVFALLNLAILRTALRASRAQNPRASFFGTWIFCFWCGEIVQMFSGDLITFWRVLPIYFWVLATAAREAGE